MADIKCRILAIDGGGIRGVIPAYILQQLEATLGGKQLFEVFDVIAGTSTGGIISLGLTTPSSGSSKSAGSTLLPYTAQDILDFYLNDESELFVPSNAGAKYYGTNPDDPKSGIQPWLQNAFGATLTLSQARASLAQSGLSMPKQVLTTGFTINTNNPGNVGPYLFNWQDAANSAADDYYVWEAARATSAAPTYFPAAQIGTGAPGGSGATGRWVVDGGMVANNPALYALAEASRLGLYESLDEVFLLSLGTGLFNPGIANSDDYNWGTMSWLLDEKDTQGDEISPLIQVMGAGNILAPDAQLMSLMPWGNYWRIDPPISFSETQMAGTDQSALQTTAESSISAGGDGYYAYLYAINVLGGTLPSNVDLSKMTPPARKADRRKDAPPFRR
ncbi:MAG TPA: patatin-like phospholipase family protein [Archangium sp.]|uniref:patatin-like phospholipase family protein n=1 Tax=Archangium sp. TaxID=1872627 RepID=UPI002E35E7D8|nr:patatin-like phospholipase family protein [Archangium sp.]HEX5744910.1 patatin-like phospholipase family protein [Archangium sp.]